MQNFRWVIYCCLPFVFSAAFPQLPQGEIGGSKIVKFKSRINSQDYTLYIKLPPSYSDSSKKRYPVMYVLDAQWSFVPVMEIRGGLLYDNLICEAIFVGIAFPENYFANRNRDFTPTRTSMDSASGGAPKFIEVIRNEIMKKIDSGYRTDRVNNGLLGGSSGGLFVLYALFNDPTLFNSYVANSPSLNYDDGVIFRSEQVFSKKSRVLNAKLFLSTGGYEEEIDPFPLFNKFNDQLKESKYEGLKTESLVIDKMGHVSAGFYAIGRGLEFVFGKQDVMVDSVILDKYAGHYEQGLNFIRTGNSLYLDMGVKKIRLSAATHDNFYFAGGNGMAEFTKDDKGKVIGISFKTADGNFFSKRVD